MNPIEEASESLDSDGAQKSVISDIMSEHEDIERELIELEEISSSNEINYPNLLHVFTRLHDIWNEHELKEEKIFPILRRRENLVIPVIKVLFEHKSLKQHKDAIKKAIDSGSEIYTKKVLDIHGKIIIEKLRQHIAAEDDILYTIALNEVKEEDIKEIEEALG